LIGNTLMVMLMIDFPAATELSTNRSELNNLKSDMESKQVRHEREKKKKQEVKARLSEIMNTTSSLEAKAAEVS
jgi:uncharacterized protein YhaN